MSITFTSIDKLLKPRGKGTGTEHPGVNVSIQVPKTDSLEDAVEALLTVSGNDTAAALETLNSALERAATDKVYGETFGDEIKIRAMIKTMVAAGVPEAIADTTARTLFATKGAEETVSQ